MGIKGCTYPFYQFQVRQKFKIMCAIVRISVALQQCCCVNSGGPVLLNLCGGLKLVCQNLSEPDYQIPNDVGFLMENISKVSLLM